MIRLKVARVAANDSCEPMSVGHPMAAGEHDGNGGGEGAGRERGALMRATADVLASPACQIGVSVR